MWLLNSRKNRLYIWLRNQGRRWRFRPLGPQLRLTFLLAALVAAFALWSVLTFLGRFRSFQFDPEPRLSPMEAKKVADEHPLPPAASAVPSVAKRIHFMYRNYLVDSKLRPFLASWRQVYPEYKIYFWTDKEINELVKRKYAKWEHLYHHQLSNYLERSDTARAFILDAMGGWYADLDSRSLRDGSGITADHTLILPLEPYVHAIDNFNKRRLASNAIMYSVPGHPFWMYHLERLQASLADKPMRKSTLKAVFITGPVMLTEVALNFMQAHHGTGCPGIWCPYLAPPLLFLPTYDNHTVYMRQQLQLYCAYTFSHPDLTEDCKRYRDHNYMNYVDAKLSYTYHAFVHLNERRGAAARSGDNGDVRTWGLGLTIGAEILDDVAKV